MKKGSEPLTSGRRAHPHPTSSYPGLFTISVGRIKQTVAAPELRSQIAAGYESQSVFENKSVCAATAWVCDLGSAYGEQFGLTHSLARRACMKGPLSYKRGTKNRAAWFAPSRPVSNYLSCGRIFLDHFGFTGNGNRITSILVRLNRSRVVHRLEAIEIG